MTRTSLAERLTRLEQQKNRLQQAEARLKTDERKARTRRLIEAGGLVDKAGLVGLEPNTLYGALLALKANASDAVTLERWRKAGGQAFDREQKARDEGKEPLVLTLHGPQPASVTTALRSLGFRWSKVMGHWEGIARHDQAQALATELGGSLRRLAPPDSENIVATAAA